MVSTCLSLQEKQPKQRSHHISEKCCASDLAVPVLNETLLLKSLAKVSQGKFQKVRNFFNTGSPIDQLRKQLQFAFSLTLSFCISADPAFF